MGDKASGLSDGCSTEVGDVAPAEEKASLPVTDEELVMFHILRLSYGDKPPNRSRIPPGVWAAVHNYDPQIHERFEFASEDDVAEFVDIKMHEAAFLKSQYDRLRPIEGQMHAELNAAIRAQAAHPKSSSEWSHMQTEAVQPTLRRLLDVRKGLEALPDVIQKSEEAARSLRGLGVAGQREKGGKKVARRDCLGDRKAKLTAQIAKYGSWIYGVVPASEPYRQLDAQLRKAREELEKMHE